MSNKQKILEVLNQHTITNNQDYLSDLAGEIESALSGKKEPEKATDVYPYYMTEIPEDDQVYFIIESGGSFCECGWDDDLTDHYRFNLNNCFATKELAEKALKVKQAQAALQYESDVAWMNHSKALDWSNRNQSKWCVNFHANYGVAIELAHTLIAGYPFPTECSAEQAKERLGEETIRIALTGRI